MILVDCQPSLGLLTINALACAHSVLIPLGASTFALRGVALLMDRSTKCGTGLNPQLASPHPGHHVRPAHGTHP